ncbi:MAG: hypothetical protein GC206_05265 [Alphaproteobacteria bacterium]|nr:hypothetical protein [Alphaproteobacteria bacterium]
MHAWWWVIPGFVAIVGLLFLVGGFGYLFRGRPFKGGRGVIGGAVFLLIAAVLGLVGLNIQTYHRLTQEQLVATVTIRALDDPKSYSVTVAEPNEEAKEFQIRGDYWILYAHTLKWKNWATVLGLDSQYRLWRLDGLYHAVEDENVNVGTAHDLRIARPGVQNVVDVYSLATNDLVQRFAPLVDATPGTASWEPLADGAEYRVTLTQAGTLLARPNNTIASDAVGRARGVRPPAPRT